MRVNTYFTTNICLTHKKNKKFNAAVSKNNGYIIKTLLYCSNTAFLKSWYSD